MMNKIYPRKGDTQTVYLNAVVKDPSIEIGGQAEIPVHMLNWAVRSVKFLGVEFDQSEYEEVSVSDAAHL